MAPMNLSMAPVLLPVLRMWNRLVLKSRFNARPPLGWIPGHLWGRKILQGPASRAARRLRITGTLSLAEDELDRLRPRLRVMNAELQQYIEADLADLGYIV